jgi:(p)ppGpp synthase/HD superfamily hydrolase
MLNPEKQEPSGTLHLTARFTRAIDYARNVHVGARKKTEVPYMAHLLGVASLVLGEAGHVPFPVTEDMAFAALLHDAVEDAGGWPRLHDIEANFGKEVAKIVEGCSDSFEQDSNKKKEWEERKKDYLERLRNEPESTLLVSVADKLYNVRSIVRDRRSDGAKVWERFKRGPEPQLWYYSEVLKVFQKRCPDWRIVNELGTAVAELTQIAKGESA